MTAMSDLSSPSVRPTGQWLWRDLRGVALFLVILLYTLPIFGVFVVLAPLKLVIPVPPWQRLITRPLLGLAELWAAVMLWLFRVTHTTAAQPLGAQ